MYSVISAYNSECQFEELKIRSAKPHFDDGRGGKNLPHRLFELPGTTYECIFFSPFTCVFRGLHVVGGGYIGDPQGHGEHRNYFADEANIILVKEDDDDVYGKWLLLLGKYKMAFSLRSTTIGFERVEHLEKAIKGHLDDEYNFSIRDDIEKFVAESLESAITLSGLKSRKD